MSDEKPKILPVREGIPTGHANERTMANKVDTTSFNTRIQENPDGSTTRLRTRGGALEYVTTRPAVEEKPDELDWVYSLPSVQNDGSGGWLDAYTTRNLGGTPHKVPMLDYTMGPRTRRYGLKKNGDGTVSPKVQESKYEGQTSGKRVGGGHWIGKNHIVTWALPIGRGAFNNDSDGQYESARYHTVRIYDRKAKRWGKDICETANIGPTQYDYVLRSACITHADDGTRVLRLLKVLNSQITTAETGTSNSSTVFIQDFTTRGTFIRSHYATVAELDAASIFPDILAWNQAWSSDGRTIVVTALTVGVKKFTVSCPAIGTDIAIAPSTLVIPWSVVEGDGNYYEHQVGFSAQGEVVHCVAKFARTKSGTRAQDYPYTTDSTIFPAGDYPVFLNDRWDIKLYVDGAVVYNVAEEWAVSFVDTVVRSGVMNYVTGGIAHDPPYGGVQILDLCAYSKTLSVIVSPNKTNYLLRYETYGTAQSYVGGDPSYDAFVRIVRYRGLGQDPIIAESPTFRNTAQGAADGAWDTIHKRFLMMTVGYANPPGSFDRGNPSLEQSALAGLFYKDGNWHPVVWGATEPAHHTIWPIPFQISVSPYGQPK